MKQQLKRDDERYGAAAPQPRSATSEMSVRAERFALLNLMEDAVAAKQRADMLVKELQEANDRLRLLIESATDCSIFTTDRQGIVNSWNSGSERIYGFREDEIIGRSIELLFTQEDRERQMHIREMEEAIANGRALDERWHRRKDGSVFYASGVTQPLGGSGNEGFVKIARDMTEHIHADQARREKELMQTLVDAQEAERRRIARDLHDELGQQLTALRLKLDGVSKEAPKALESSITEVQDIAKSIDEGVDFLAWELRPAALDDLGLVPALEKYVREWSNYAQVAGSLNASVKEDRRFDPPVETALYRIVQEGLNNIHKHAGAKHADVLLRLRNGNIIMIITDDGVGFEPAACPPSGKGIGLIGIKERVQMIGGKFEIESSVGSGTTLYIKAPTKKAPAN